MSTKTLITEEEFMRLPMDGCKYELVEGEIKVSPAGMEHEGIGALLIHLLAQHVRNSRLGRVYGSSVGYKLPSGNIRSPDVSFVRTERLPGGRSPRGFGDFAPDLAVEILSPGDDQRDVADKIGEYLKWAVPLVWLIDPEKQTVTVYRSLTDVRVLEASDELDGEDVIPGFRCSISDLFE